MDHLNIARYNMTHHAYMWDVKDPTLLELLKTTPREPFVTSAFQHVAYSDAFLPIGYGQVTLPPKLTARILQALEISSHNRLLEIGTGTGYLTTLLARLGQSVVTIEIIPELARLAAINFSNLELSHIESRQGNGLQNWPKDPPYDTIILTGSVPTLPLGLAKQLSLGGRLFAAVGNTPAMSAMVLERTGEDSWKKAVLFETDIPPLQLTTGECFKF
jgi:protein-L-isoaspartate(D-aspartate) O-methyltransferase